MDKDRKTGKESITKNSVILEPFSVGLRIERANELTNIIHILEESHKKVIATIDKKLKSRWIRGNDKAFMTINKAHLNITHNMAKDTILTLFVLEQMQKRIDKIEKKRDVTEQDINTIKTITINWQPYIDAIKQAIDNTTKWLEENR